MTRTTRSAVVTEPKEVELREIELPDIGDDEAILELELTSVCGADPKVYKGEFRPEVLPAVLGHEIVGRIDEIGATASENYGVEAGDRVVVDQLRRCGSCRQCIAGRYNHCERGGGNSPYGMTPLSKDPGVWGGYSQHMYLGPGTVLYPIDESVPKEAAALGTGVVGNSVNWIEHGGTKQVEQSLVIQGPGPQGLSLAIVASKMGFAPVVVTGVPRDEERLALAERLGADATACAPPEELLGATREALGAEHADVVVNLTNSPASAQDSIDLVGVGGTIVYVNVVGDVAPSQVDFDPLVLKDASIEGVLSSTSGPTEQAIRLIERDPEPFVEMMSDVYPLAETEDALRAVGGLDDEVWPTKAAVDPWA
jgi:threonine dehydrogenase-like Zn-dependent dehydrogenase